MHWQVTNRLRHRRGLLPAMLIVLMSSQFAVGLENVTWRDGDVRREVAGRVIVEARDGGVMLEGRDGGLWTIQPDELIARSSDDQPFTPLPRALLEQQLLAELGTGFAVHRTAHYTLIYNTSPDYARWCAALYERLYASFHNFWRTRGFKLQPPELPLVAVVFGDKASYVQAAEGELGAAAQSIVGYYSLRSNRIYTYDLTGADQRLGNGRTRTRSEHIQRILMQPQAAPLVATLIHEATHQLSYNSGLQSRYVDNPLWVSEGMAMYFEAPDHNSDRGWRTLGQVNVGRLDRFRRNLPSRADDALRDLIASDQRMRAGETAVDAYAESWALWYFLIRVYPEQFTRYLKELAQRPPLSDDTPEKRLQVFQRCMEMSLAELDQEFLRYIARLN